MLQSKMWPLPLGRSQYLLSDPQKYQKEGLGWGGSVPSGMYGICNYFFVPTLFLEPGFSVATDQIQMFFHLLQVSGCWLGM